jgi:cytochrome oxidase assembly protein ShyY1
VSWQSVVLVVVSSFQVIALAWIAAWQQRAAQVRRRFNGAVEAALEANGSAAAVSRDPL